MLAVKTNAQFIEQLFPTPHDDERFWGTDFSGSPETEGKWRGNEYAQPKAFKNKPHNAYFCVALLKQDAEGNVARKKVHFSRLPVIAVDDIEGDPACTWRIQTSAGCYQTGWKLDEPITDMTIAENLNKALANMKLIKADASGNNVVRYVRLPFQVNQKYDPEFHAVLEHFDADAVFSLEDVCDLLGIDPYSLKTPNKVASEPVASFEDVTQPKVSDAELVRLICTAESLHEPLNILTARYAHRGMDAKAIEAIVIGFMTPHDDGTDRFAARMADVPRIIAGAIEKYQADPPDMDTEPVEETPCDMEPFCDELLNLTGVVGQVQDYIFNRMMYPSRAEAGFAAIASIAAIGQGHMTVKSFGGLALNEYFMQASHTGFGKEDIRRAMAAVIGAAECSFGHEKPKLIWKLPASQQGIHLQLQSDRSLYFMSDEFAEWLSGSHKDQHRQEAVGYLLELYTSATKTGVCVPQAATKEYRPVDYPRVGIYASTTQSRIAEAMTGGQARSGAYNRIVCFISDQGVMPVKRYSGQVYDIPDKLYGHLGLILEKDNNEISFTPDALAKMEQMDRDVFEVLKFKDPNFAGRLNEQTIKMAAVFALADNRKLIEVADYTTAAAIRLNLYRRMAALVEHEGIGDDLDKTGAALEQVKNLLARYRYVRYSDLPKFCRKYRELSLAERNLVTRAIVAEGYAVETKKGRLDSQVFR